MPFSRVVIPLDTQQRALEEALREAKSCGDTKFSRRGDTAIPYEFAIPAIAHQLLRMQRRDPKRDQPQRSLKNLRNATAQLVKVLDGLSPDVLAAVLAALPELNIRELHNKVRLLNAVANAAGVRGRQSAPEKVCAYKIAQTVAWHYYCLTGRDPTVSRPEGKKPRGAFFDLLTTVYKVLGVKASADSQEKKLKKEWSRIKKSFLVPASEFNRQKIST